MRFTDIFIRRPVLAGVVSILIFLVGLKSLLSMQVRQYPELTNTVITITTVYPGASAELMQGFVTNPIQRVVASAAGVDYITSTSQQSTSIVTAYIRLNFPANEAMTEIMAKVQEVNSELPKEIESPVIKKTSGESYAILYIGFGSKTLKNEEITDYVNRQIVPRLSTIYGVAAADVLGGQTFAMRLWVDPQKLASRNLTYEDVARAIQENNYQAAPGQLKGYYTVKNVQANTDLHTIEEFKNLIIRVEGTKVIRLSDLGTIELAAEKYNSSVRMNGEQSVFIGIKPTPTGNPLTVVKNVKKVLRDFEPNLPAGLEMKTAYDATKFIEASIWEVAKTLLEASIIVIFIIFMFLGSFRAIFIPLVTIPLSIVGVGTLLLALGFSINTLTLLAMVLAIGLVVDDAIVVVENIHRHLTRGKTPFEAAIIGTREIAGPVITMTITLMAVYAPIAFMGGITGALFREFALTLAGSVVISGVIALTLSPMMCSQLLNKADMEKPLVKRIDHALHVMTQEYTRHLRKMLKSKSVVTAVFGLIIFSSFLMSLFISKELAPQEDQGILMVSTKGPQLANIDYMQHYMTEVIDIMGQVPEKNVSFAVTGRESVQTGFAGLILRPWEERDTTSHTLQHALQEKLNAVVGLKGFCFQPPSLPGNAGGLPVQFVINSMADYRTIYKVMNDLVQAAKASGLFFVTDSDLKFDNPTAKVVIHRDKANQAGASLRDIGLTLSFMMGEHYVNRFSLQGRSYKVIPLTPRVNRLSPEAILSYYIPTSSGKTIPLSSIATVENEVEPNQLFQFNQINSATFQAFPVPWVKLGDVVDFLTNYAKTHLPQGFSYDFLSESRQYIQEGNALYWTFIFAVIIIFLVLAAQFESLRDPFIVMLSVPMSTFGAIFVLFIGLSTLNIYSQIGLVTLVGLITKHGILIVEFANHLQLEQGYNRERALIQAATTRLRPILMTTAAMVFGLIPLLLSKGAGSASRFSIGITIVAGMLIGTFFTLFVVPAFYMLIGREKRPLASVEGL